MHPEPPARAGSVIGRDRELGVLRAALDRVESAGAALVLVTGEPGIGKTTLLDELARGAAAAGVRVIRGDASEQVTTGFGLWAGPRRQLAIGAGDASADPDERRWDLLDDLAAALGRAGRTLVVLDDIHWADDASLWVLDRLPAAVVGPVLIVAGSRDAVAAPGVRALRSATPVPLGGLDPAEVGELARRLDPRRAALDPDALHARTGGNPLFVREVVVAPVAVDVPGEVGPLLEAVLDRLPAATREAVGALALAGDDAPPTVLAAALGTTAAEAADRLEPALAGTVLVRDEQGALRFRHALLREAAVGAMDPAARRARNRDLAGAWAEAGPDVAGRARGAASGLAAVPLVDAEGAAAAALDAAAGLRSAGDPVAAAALVREAASVLAAFAPAAAAARVAVALRLGEALDAAGDRLAAATAFADAVAVSATLDDPVLEAEAVLGVDRHVPMYDDDPTRLDRLRAAEQALPAGDHPLRAGLLGRISVALDARNGSRQEVAAAAEAGLAMARRIGDAELVAQNLIDRSLSARTAEALEERSAAADELRGVAERTRRGDLAMVAEEWAWCGALLHGDLGAADDACARLEVAAAMTASPVRRFGALSRRAGLEALAGRRAGALDLLDDLRAVGRLALPPPEAWGVEEGIRTILVRLSGRADPQLADLQVRSAQVVRGPGFESAFFMVHVAVTLLTLGRVDEAERLADRWAPTVTEAPPGTVVPSTIANLATLVADLGAARHAPGVRRHLEPFSGLVSLEFGLVADRPVDTLLGRLALLAGDLDGAVRHADLAVARSVASGSPAYEAWAEWYRAEALDRSGRPDAAADARARAAAAAARGDVVLPEVVPAAATRSSATATATPTAGGGPARAPSSAPGAGAATATRVGGGWFLDTPLGSGAVPASRGLDQLVRVLAAGPDEVAATDLAGAPGAPVGADLGPMLDPAAKRAYRRRIGELEDEIDEADRFADGERSARAQLELDALLAELRRAVGLGGRDRPNASGTERARVNVTRSLRRAIAAVGTVVPDLAAHLEVSVRTGSGCCYRPDPAATLRWTVEDAGP